MTSIEEMLDAALTPVFDFYADESNQDKQYRVENRRGTLFRLDFDLNVSDGDTPMAETVTLMNAQARYDILDLVKNGDTSLSNDPLLKALDGAKKKGRDPSAIRIPGAKLSVVPKERKKTIEYTLYIGIILEWDESTPVEKTAKEEISV